MEMKCVRIGEQNALGIGPCKQLFLEFFRPPWGFLYLRIRAFSGNPSSAVLLFTLQGFHIYYQGPSGFRFWLSERPGSGPEIVDPDLQTYWGKMRQTFTFVVAILWCSRV